MSQNPDNRMENAIKVRTPQQAGGCTTLDNGFLIIRAKKKKRERETEDIIPIAFFRLGLEKTRVMDAWTTLQPSRHLSGVTASWREGHGPER